MIRTLVVDDSATMRRLIALALDAAPDIEVVGQAACAAEARSAMKALNPDVVTLDVEMPEMNGLDFLDKIMRLRPTPVIMISSLTSRGAEATLKALELGAFDCVAKSSITGQGAFDNLAATVRAAAQAKVRVSARSLQAHAGVASTACHISLQYRSDGRVVAIGSSTGGVEALLTILTQLPENGPPTVVTQHMPATFTRSFANRLDRSSRMRVLEATDGAALRPGQVYLAPGGPAHLEVVRHDVLRCRLVAADPVTGHRPSVDVLFSSVAKATGSKAVGVILTGMGRDGAQGLLSMRQAGATTIGQDEASCVVYGMPKVAVELLAVEKQMRLERIASEIITLTNILS